MPKWLLHNCHCHRPQEIPSENFQASLPTHCPHPQGGDWRLVTTHHHEMVSICCYVVCSSGMIDVFWVSPDLSLGVMAGVHPWSPSPSTSQPQPMSSAAKKQAQTSTCKTNVGWYLFLMSFTVTASELDNFAFCNKLQRASVACDSTGPGWAGSCSSLLWPGWWTSPVCSTDHIRAGTESSWFMTIYNFLPGKSQLF